MSRDEQLQELRQFQQSLVQFNQLLETSIRELKQRYRSSPSRWQDQWQQEDKAIVGSLNLALGQYFERESPVYVERLKSEIEILREGSHVG